MDAALQRAVIKCKSGGSMEFGLPHSHPSVIIRGRHMEMTHGPSPIHYSADLRRPLEAELQAIHGGCITLKVKALIESSAAEPIVLQGPTKT
jgi:hypothetical protein